jgi:hypothetical protein
MTFQKLVQEVLNEDMMAGGDGSVFGSNVSSGGVSSTDFYAPGDQRIPNALFPGFVTRTGSTSKRGKKRGKTKARRNKRRNKKRSK